MGVPADFLRPCNRTAIRIPYSDPSLPDPATLPLGEIIVFPPGPNEDNYLIVRFSGHEPRKGTITASAVGFVTANYQGDGLPPHESWNGSRTVRHAAERAYIGKAAFDVLGNDPGAKPFGEHLSRGHENLLKRLEAERQQLYKESMPQ